VNVTLYRRFFNWMFSQQPPRSSILRMGMALVACSLIFSWTTVTLADEPSPTISRASLGISGVFKVGRWTPVEFDLTGPDGLTVTPVVRAADPDGRPTLQPFPSVTLSSQPRRIRGVIRSGRLDGAVQIQIHDERHPLTDPPAAQTSFRIEPGGTWRALRQTSQIWVTIGDQPMLEKGFQRWTNGREEFIRLVKLPESDADFWMAEMLDGVDVVVLNGETVLSKHSAQSLSDWVSRGGRLLIGVGDAAASLAENPLSAWLPIRVTGRLDVTKLSGFNDLVPRSSSLRTLTTLPAAQFERGTGSVVASGLVEPLALRSAYGLGSVTLVAVRLDIPPLLNWEPESQSYLAAVLAGVPNPVELANALAARAEAASELNPTAVTDLQVQLNQSLDHFESIQRPSHWQVIGWIALFAIIIGPVDYFLVTYVFKRPEWTWGTLIVWSLLGIFTATTLADRRNDKPVVSRQLNLIDLDASTNRAVARTWYGFYSDQTQRQKIRFEPQTDLVKQAQIADLRSDSGWVSRPSEGFRGMYRSGGLDESQAGYQFSADRSGIENLPLEIWSSGAIASEWYAHIPREMPIQADLHLTGINRLGGTIQHQLSEDLTDWLIAFGNFAYFDRSGPGGTSAPLRPGQKWDLSSAGSNLLRGRLISTLENGTASGERLSTDLEMNRSNYDTQSSDPFRIALTTSFYRVLGGESFTRLQNQTLNRLDVSPVLELNRAVLFGRVKQSPSKVTVDEQVLPQESNATFVRIIVPVRALERTSDTPPTQDILDYRR